MIWIFKNFLMFLNYRPFIMHIPSSALVTSCFLRAYVLS